MKTIFRSVTALLLVLAMVLSLSGCCLVAPRLAQKNEFADSNAAAGVHAVADTAAITV